jgi:hypothetical protein
MHAAVLGSSFHMAAMWAVSSQRMLCLHAAGDLTTIPTVSWVMPSVGCVMLGACSSWQQATRLGQWSRMILGITPQHMLGSLALSV